MGLSTISLFSGICGIELAGKKFGARTVCYVERDPYAQGVIMSRIRSGELDDAPIWDDVTTFDGKPWKGKVDVITGGFPCQDLSVAGKRAGIYGSRSGLWFEYARIIGEVRPRYVIVENVPGLVSSGGIGAVLGSLAKAGYDAEWFNQFAYEIGAKMQREREFIVAFSNKEWRDGFNGIQKIQEDVRRDRPQVVRDLLGVDVRIPFRMDRIGCVGNSVLPRQAEKAWAKIFEIESNQ